MPSLLPGAAVVASGMSYWTENKTLGRGLNKHMKLRTSCAVSSDIDVTDARVWMRESWKLGNEWLGNHFGVFTLGVARSLDVSLPESGTRCNVVNVLLNMRWHVICFGRNVVRSGRVLPDIKLGNQ
jgi:hypothetical protein